VKKSWSVPYCFSAQTALKPLYDQIIYNWDEPSQSIKGDLSAVATQLRAANDEEWRMVV
jgi:sRNA-binding protein